MRKEYRAMLVGTILGLVLLSVVLSLRSRNDPAANSGNVDARPVGAQDTTLLSTMKGNDSGSTTPVGSDSSRKGLGITRSFFLEKYASLDFEEAPDASGQDRFVGSGTGVHLELIGPAENLTGAALKVRVKTGGKYIEKAAAGLQYFALAVNLLPL